MHREESVYRSYEEATMEVQRLLKKLSSALSQYPGYVPQPAREILDSHLYPSVTSVDNQVSS